MNAAPITPDERAAMRALADRMETYYGEADAASGIQRLLDALDTAEAKARLVETYLRMEREAARRNLERAGRAEAEVARLRAAPVWDEDTVTEAIAATLRTHAWSAGVGGCRPGSGCSWDGSDAEGEQDEHAALVASAVLAVVREHAPVRPDRETIARAIDPRPWDPAHTPIGWSRPTIETARARALVQADAVLDLFHGQPRAEAQAEALREAARAAATDNDAVASWLDARADRLDPKEK